MKGVMVKKIFKVIGLVLVSVLGFVGATVGVMAAMGKFKTPVVYPTVLEFAVTEQTVIERKSFDPNIDWAGQFADKNKAPTIESFILSGSNPNEEHAVNQKDCYIWFASDDDSKLITLCEENGKPLTKALNQYYLVKCNEPIYYMINKLDDPKPEAGEIDGEVVLNARSLNDNVKKPSSPMTIFIDRRVEGVFVANMGEPNSDSGLNTQTITVGVNSEFKFNYVVGIDNPSTDHNEAVEQDKALVLRPITNRSAKAIELYYDNGNDYIQVTPENVANTELPLHTFLTYDVDEGVFKFKASSANPSEYKFYVAVFGTYEEEQSYREKIEGKVLPNPYFDRVSHMVATELIVSVLDTEITKVSLNGSEVILGLYQENTIYLSDNTKENNNLGLAMKKGEIDDTSRFDESVLTDFSGVISTTKTPIFTSETYENDSWSYGDARRAMTIVETKISVGENLKIVDYVYETANPNNKLYCTNGVAVYNTQDNTMSMLLTGTYIAFYRQNADNEFSLADFEYEAEVVGSGTNRYWKVTAKTMPQKELQEGESLCAGVLVVNNSGAFKSQNFFATRPLTLQPVDLQTTFKNSRSHDLAINFYEGLTDYPKLGFDDVVTFNSDASYNACVFVVEDSATNIVKTLPNINYYDETTGKTYVVVGDFEIDRNGKKIFVNKIIVNENVTKDNNFCKIHLLQLKNSYQQTIYDILNDEVITNGKTFANTEVVNLMLDAQKEVNINAKYIINEKLIEYKYYNIYNGAGDPGNVEIEKVDGKYVIYENTLNHKLVITSPSNEEMLEKIVEFYSIDVNSLYVEYGDVTLQNMINLDGLVVTFDAGKSPVDENTPIKVKCTVGNVQPVVVSLGEVYILSGSPETIILNHGIEQVDPITLFKTIDDVKKEINKNTYLKIITDYDVVNKVYTYQVKIYLNGVGYDIDAVSDLDVVFNSQISSPSALGFQDEVDKGQTYPIIYAVTDSDILNVAKLAEAGKPNFVEKQGETILSVTIDKTTAYLKVVTDTSAFKFTTDQNKTTFDENKKDLKLSELISLTHLSSDENVTPSLEKVVKILNVKAISYGDGALIVDPSDDLSSWTLKKQIDNAGQIAYEPVLNITNNANDGWSFSKTNAHISLTISFDVQTIAGTKSIQLTLRSSVSIAVTDSWNNNRIFYARTKVQLLDDKGQDTYAVFRVTKEAGVTDDVSFQVNNSSSYISDSEGVVFEVTDSHIGSAQVQVLLNGVQIARFDFVVKPNVVATLKQDVVLESERTLANGNAYSISDLYDLSAYRTDITYGSASENLYIAANATETPTDLSISINTTNNDNPKLTYDTKLEVGPMVEINPDQDPIREITLWCGSDKIRTDNFVVKNKHSVEINLDETEELNKFVFKALKYYPIFASVSGFELTKMEADDLEFDTTEVPEMLKIKTTITDTVTVDVILTFSNGTQTLTYKVEIVVLPYTPEFRPDRTQAYSGSMYDLLNGIYNAKTDAADYIINDSNIQKLFVTAIYNEACKEDITNKVISGFTPMGYTKGIADPHCEMLLKDIVGSELKVNVEFTITYAGEGLTYTYYVPLTIKNRMSIAVQYPESDKTLSQTLFKFKEGFESDATKLGGTLKPGGNTCNLTGLPYEAVLVHTDKSITINLVEDHVKKVNRIVVKNERSGSIDNNDLILELIGYNSVINMNTYVEAITCADNQIVLPQAGAGFSGVLIFKISTISGNYAYYTLYIYCAGTKANVNSNLEVVYKTTASNHLQNSTELTNSIAKTGDTNTTYAQLISSIATDNIFINTFKMSYIASATKIYLYRVETTGDDYDYFDFVVFNEFETKWNAIKNKLYYFDGTNYVLNDGHYDSSKTYFIQVENEVYAEYTAFDDEWALVSNQLYYSDDHIENAGAAYDPDETYYQKVNRQYTEISNQKIISNEQFHVVTLGLVWVSGHEEYCYGTVTIYVQSTNVTGEPTGLNYKLPNGHFEANIDGNKPSFALPFTGWTTGDVTAEILPDGLDAQGYKLVGGIVVPKDASNDVAELKPTDKYISFDGTTIKFGRKVDADLKFVVKYEYDSNTASDVNALTTVFVTYTYQAIVLPTQSSKQISVGEFDKDVDVLTFVKTIDIESSTAQQGDKTNKEYFFGTYDGEYEIYVGESKLETNNHVNASNGKISRDANGVLTFDQDVKEHLVDLTIKYIDLDDGNVSRTFTFKVCSGVYLDDSSTDDNSGLDTSKRILTVNNSTYSSNVGSSLTINYDATCRLYTIGGLKVYTNANSFLELTFDEIGYIVKGSNLTEIGNVKIDATSSVNFTHVALEAKPITMTVNVLRDNDSDYTKITLPKGANAKGYYSAPGTLVLTDTILTEPADYYTKGVKYADSTRNLYVSVVPTYVTLNPTYLAEGADHENVLKNTSVNLHETLLDSSRIKLLVNATSTPDGSKVFYKYNTSTNKYEAYKLATAASTAGYYEIPSDLNLQSMGFATFGNPNFIDFTVNENATIKTLNENKEQITFNTVTQNTICEVRLNNDAGLTKNSIVYNYQIMPGDSVDGLSYAETNGYYDSYQGTETPNPLTHNYVSFTLNDTKTNYSNADHEAIDADRPFVIGKMIDEKNGGVFKIDSYTINSTNVPTHNVPTPYIIRDGSNITDPTQEVVGGYINAVQYKISSSGYQFYITLDMDNLLVELIVVRASSVTQNEFVIILNVGGVNGGTSLIDGLEIVLSNHQIHEEFKTKEDDVFSGDLINLFEDSNDTDALYNNGKFIENGGTKAPQLTYALAESTYVVDGNTKVITASEIDNDLFTYNQTARTIRTKAVGQNVSAVLNFTVRNDNYILKVVTYKMCVNLNMQFVVNGGLLSANKGFSDYETDFVLTNKDETQATFPIVKEFISKSELPATETDYKKTESYNVLVYDLYRIQMQGNPDATEEELLMLKDNVAVSVNSVTINGDLINYGDILTITNQQIIFKKDFTGEIELKLSVETDNGTYSVTWTIYVTGILTLEQTSANPIDNQTIPFASSSEVAMIKSTKDTGVGIVAKTSTKFGSDYIDLGAPKVSYEYKINVFNTNTQNMSNKELFDVKTDYEYYKGSGSGEGEFSEGIFTLKLPNVPAAPSAEGPSYLVTYKVYIEYAGLTFSDNLANNKVQVFYLSYMVINLQKVNVYTYDKENSKDLSSANVNVDTGVENSGNIYYLNLFFYEETLTEGSTKYTMKYSGGNVTLTVGANTPLTTSTSADNNEKAFGTEYKYDTETRILSKNNGGTYKTLGVMTNSGTRQYSNADKSINSVFISEFSNIFAYKDFIDTYLYDETNNPNKCVQIGEKTFKLVEISGGRYGIDLNEYGKDEDTTDDVLFNNELKTELSLVDNGVKTVTISPYSSENKNGFRLYANSNIKAKTDNGGVRISTILPLTDYFNDSNTTDDLTFNSMVIGVGELASAGSWVTGANSYKLIEGNYATINIPKGDDTNNSYDIKKVKYIGGSSSAPYYTIAEEFYYIETASNLVVPKYSVGLETTHFKLNYTPNGDLVGLDLSSAIRLWSMNADGKLINTAASVSSVVVDDGFEFKNKIRFENNKIQISKFDLIQYKFDYPTKNNYPKFSTKITAEEVTIACDIEFMLPKTIELTDTELTNIDFTDYNSIVDEDGKYVEYDSVAHKITINETETNAYFNEHSDETMLKINCVATHSNGETVEIIIVVNKPAET